MKDTFRQTYTELDDEQKMKMKNIKAVAQEMLDSWNEAVPTDERSERARCMNIARTNLETAVMYAVKAVTTPQE